MNSKTWKRTKELWLELGKDKEKGTDVREKGETMPGRNKGKEGRKEAGPVHLFFTHWSLPCIGIEAEVTS